MVADLMGDAGEKDDYYDEEGYGEEDGDGRKRVQDDVEFDFM